MLLQYGLWVLGLQYIDASEMMYDNEFSVCCSFFIIVDREKTLRKNVAKCGGKLEIGMEAEYIQ